MTKSRETDPFVCYVIFSIVILLSMFVNIWRMNFEIFLLSISQTVRGSETPCLDLLLSFLFHCTHALTHSMPCQSLNYRTILCFFPRRSCSSSIDYCSSPRLYAIYVALFDKCFETLFSFSLMLIVKSDGFVTMSLSVTV